MNPHHLRTFLAVQKHLNYTHAAEELFLSQPAVSRHIHQLEDSLGVVLYEHKGKKLHPTEAAHTLGEEAAKVLGTIERAAEAVRAHRSAERGRLRVGGSATPGLYLLPPLLQRFCELHPSAELHYRIANSALIERMLVRNELDIGFVGGSLSSPDLVVRDVVEDRIVCFSSSAHRLAGRARVRLSALASEIWIVRERGSATRQLFETWLSEAGYRFGKTIEVQSTEAAKALTEAGLGISFMSEHGLRRELDDGRLVRLPLIGLRLQRPIRLARHVGKRTSPVMAAFIEIVDRWASAGQRIE
jgi:DNA-binding transcriptional LysR family regulator